MTNLKNLLNQKQTLLNQLTDLNKQIIETQAIDKFGINLESIKELQNFQSNNSTLESIRDELLITLDDSDINQFLSIFA
jgi:flagellar biosynthesis/type III secretory pathway chaperone